MRRLLAAILLLLPSMAVAQGSFAVPTYTAGSLGSSATVATPSFSPGGGSYSSTQTVTISTATSLAVLCYTTDGSTPTESGHLCSGGTTSTYSTPISVATTQTVKAIGTKATYTDSAVGSAAYTISASGSSTYTNNFAANYCGSTPASCSATLASSTIPSGQLIAVTVGAYGCSSKAACEQSITVTDSASSSYTPASHSESADAPFICFNEAVLGQWACIEQFYTLSSGSGAGTQLTAAISSGPPVIFLEGTLYSYTGTAAHDADASGIVTGYSYADAVTSGTLTTTLANDRLVAGSLNWSGTATLTAGSDGASGTYTMRTTSSSGFMGQQDIPESSIGTYSASVSAAHVAYQTWGIGVMAFKF